MSQTTKKLSRFLKKRRVKILLVFLVASVIFIGFSSLTLANGENDKGGLENFLQGLINSPLWIFNLILTGIRYLAGWFLMLCGRLLNATLSPALYNFMNEGIVVIGWGIVRDVCNLFFILILLIIAFATILRLETYDIKRMLPRLLGVALLINFSKMICGLIIDASQILMNTFLFAMGGKNFSEFVANVTNLSNVFRAEFSLESLLNTNTDNTVSIALGALFFIILGVVFLILAVLLLIRIIALWILIILAPLAWLIGIIPTGAKFANQWWENFIKYCFFGPIMAFFLYLSWASWNDILKMINAAPKEGGQAIQVHGYLSYVVMIILLLVSVVAAKSMGVAGAGFMVGGAKRLAFGKKGKGGLIRGFGKWGAAGAGMAAAGGGAAMRKVFKKWPRAAEIKKGIVEKAERVPVIGKPLGGPGAYAARQRAAINKQAKEYADRPTEDVRRIAGQFAPTREELRQSAGAIKLISQRPEGFEDEEKKLVERYKRAGGKESDIYGRRPDWAKEPEKVIRGMAAEPKEAKNIQVEALKDEKVTAGIIENLKEGGAWTKEHLAQMGRRGDVAEQIKNKVIQHKKEFSPQIQMWLESDAGKSVYGTKEEVEEVMSRRKRKKHA